MNSIDRIIFWEPSLSPHKTSFFSAIVKLAPKIEVVCCAQTDIPMYRKAMGWKIKSNLPFKIIIEPTDDQIELICSQKIKSTIHIFSGIRWIPIIVKALKMVRLNHANFAMMSEPRVNIGLLGKLRFLHSRISERWLCKNVQFVLAQGRNGPLWFRSVGYFEDKIFPFAYYINPPICKGTQIKAANKPIQIGYVGRLTRAKGVYEIINAVNLTNHKIELFFVGIGPEEENMRLMCKRLRIKASFIGSIEIERIGEFMSQIDLLVLVSRSDGWGVVISEALLCGTPVISYPSVGASIMLCEPLFGKLISSNSPHLIAKAISELYLSSAFSDGMRKKRKALARQLLSAESGASYFLKIIKWCFDNGVKPNPFYKA